MEFDRLVKELVKENTILQELEVLLAKKKSGQEMGLEKSIKPLQEFIATQLEYFALYLKSGIVDTRPETQKLNVLFRETIEEVWA